MHLVDLVPRLPSLLSSGRRWLGQGAFETTGECPTDVGVCAGAMSSCKTALNSYGSYSPSNCSPAYAVSPHSPIECALSIESPLTEALQENIRTRSWMLCHLSERVSSPNTHRLSFLEHLSSIYGTTKTSGGMTLYVLRACPRRQFWSGLVLFTDHTMLRRSRGHSRDFRCSKCWTKPPVAPNQALSTLLMRDMVTIMSTSSASKQSIGYLIPGLSDFKTVWAPVGSRTTATH